jgi:hypothetical protein
LGRGHFSYTDEHEGGPSWAQDSGLGSVLQAGSLGTPQQAGLLGAEDVAFLLALWQRALLLPPPGRGRSLQGCSLAVTESSVA